MDDKIIFYHKKGYKVLEILSALAYRNNIQISLRTLERRLKYLKLTRYKNQSPLNDIVCKIISELENTGQLLGYRALWNKLKFTHNLNVNRKTVEDLLRQIDPEGVSQRLAKKLKRRTYIVPGPNHIWHLDGYDKLKPYGFPIHGAIDGYSRFVIWLNVVHSNNNPRVISSLYLNTLNDRQIIPKVIRCDAGNENSLISGIHPSLRDEHKDSLSGHKSFMYGRSTANQRIEAFWSHLRKGFSQFWINFFKDMIDEGVLDNSNYIHLSCLKFCFTELLQTQLNNFGNEWNSHYIRKQSYIEGPHGKPEIMYNLPENFSSENCGFKVDNIKLNLYKELYAIPFKTKNCNDEFCEIVNLICPNLVNPKTPEEAKLAYISLLNNFNNFLE